MRATLVVEALVHWCMRGRPPRRRGQKRRHRRCRSRSARKWFIPLVRLHGCKKVSRDSNDSRMLQATSHRPQPRPMPPAQSSPRYPAPCPRIGHRSLAPAPLILLLLLFRALDLPLLSPLLPLPAFRPFLRLTVFVVSSPRPNFRSPSSSAGPLTADTESGASRASAQQPFSLPPCQPNGIIYHRRYPRTPGSFSRNDHESVFFAHCPKWV